MDYNEILRKITMIDETIKGLECQIPDSNRDKCGLRFSDGLNRYNEPKIISCETWKNAIIEFGASHGCYGYNGAYDDMSPELAHYVLRVLRALKRSIIEKAIEIAREDKKKFAEQAKEEAEKIIELVEK